MESGTLQVVDHVTILACYQIISENSIVYMEWTTPEEPDNVLLQYRIKGGQSWVELVNRQDYETGLVEGKSATWALVKGLSPDATYEFKVVVTGGENEGESDIVFCEIKDYSEDADNVNFAYAIDRIAIADNKYIMDLISKSGFNTFTTADSVYADPGNVITYTVNADGKIQITGIPEANDGGNTILDVNSINVKVHGNCYYFTDSTIIVYDEGGGGGRDVRMLTKNDLYKDMAVEIYLKGNNDIAVLVVTLM